MRVLAFDTATALTAVALCDVPDGVDVARVDEPASGARPGHASHVLALINELLVESRSGWAQIDRIAVGVGPGTFTGLRIGIATAQALAASANKPLVAVSTLRSLALGAHAAETATLAIIDARRGEVFVAGWAAHESPLSLSEAPALRPRVLRPDQLPRLIQASGTRTVAVGDGAVKFAEQLAAAGAILPPPESPLHRVSARQHCRLAAIATPSSDRRVQPDYLRVPDAELAHAD